MPLVVEPSPFQLTTGNAEVLPLQAYAEVYLPLFPAQKWRGVSQDRELKTLSRALLECWRPPSVHSNSTARIFIFPSPPEGFQDFSSWIPVTPPQWAHSQGKIN